MENLIDMAEEASELKIEPQLNYNCEQCDDIFQCAYELTSHWDKVHPTSKNVLCDICGYLSYSHEDLMNHSKAKHFDSNDSENMNADDKMDTKHMCFDCCKNFKTQRTLRNHIEKKSCNRPIKLHKCDICNRVYVNKYGLDSHKNLKHGLGSRFSCYLCDKSYATKQKLTEHLSINPSGHKINIINVKKEEQDAENKTRVPCEKCNRSYASRYGLGLHIKSKHSEVPNYMCWICQKIYSYQHTLTNHVNFAHNSQLN